MGQWRSQEDPEPASPLLTSQDAADNNLDKSNLGKTNNGWAGLTEVGMSKVNRREFVKVELGGVASPVASADALRNAQPVQSLGGTPVPTPH